MAPTDTARQHGQHTVSVVIPVYRGEQTVAEVVTELDRYSTDVVAGSGQVYRVDEIILVHDHGPDRSDTVIAALAERYPQVRAVWLSRNYGQDAATIAGMAVAHGDWIVTMDEDGQHDPAFIADFLDGALTARADLVYSKPTNTRPHGTLRNFTSRGSKLVMAALFAFPSSMSFESFRMIRGDIGRSLASGAANGTYLDVALSWVVGRTVSVPVTLRSEYREESGYNYRRLLSLFWRMFLCSGTRGLRFVSLAGLTLALAGAVTASVVIWQTLFTDDDSPAGWASTIVVLLLCSGAILVALGLIAEYLGVGLHILAGRPLYLTVASPTPRLDDPPLTSAGVPDVAEAEPCSNIPSGDIT